MTTMGATRGPSICWAGRRARSERETHSLPGQHPPTACWTHSLAPVLASALAVGCVRERVKF